jgi:hypothetical protein
VILPNFLFLDTVAIDNYLAAVEGSLMEGSFEQTDVEKRVKGGKAGLSKVVTVEGNAGTEASTETKQKRSLNNSAKFLRLYDILEEQDSIQQLDAFDPSIWDQFRRREVLEVEATIRIPKIFAITEAVEVATPLAQLMALFGQDPLADLQTRQQLEQARIAAQLFETEPIPLLFEAVSTPKFRFVASLPRQYLCCKPTELQGEAAVFGKIQRVIPPRQTYQVPLIQASLDAYVLDQNRAQRRKSKHATPGQNQVETIKGPAIVLEAIAVYR